MAVHKKVFDGTASGTLGKYRRLPKTDWSDTRGHRYTHLQARTVDLDAGGAAGLRLEFGRAMVHDVTWMEPFDVSETLDLNSAANGLSDTKLLEKDFSNDPADGLSSYLTFSVSQQGGTPTGAWYAQFELWALLQDQL